MVDCERGIAFVYDNYRSSACLEWMEGRSLWGNRQREYLRRVVANCQAMNRELVLRKSTQIAEHVRQLEETLPGEASGLRVVAQYSGASV